MPLQGANAQGSGLGNYAATYATRAGGLAVTAPPIAVIADDLSRVYGAANPAMTYTVDGLGLVIGDTLYGARDYSGADKSARSLRGGDPAPEAERSIE
jgi:hypothetical protein